MWVAYSNWNATSPSSSFQNQSRCCVFFTFCENQIITEEQIWRRRNGARYSRQARKSGTVPAIRWKEMQLMVFTPIQAYVWLPEMNFCSFAPACTNEDTRLRNGIPIPQKVQNAVKKVLTVPKKLSSCGSKILSCCSGGPDPSSTYDCVYCKKSSAFPV